MAYRKAPSAESPDYLPTGHPLTDMRPAMTQKRREQLEDERNELMNSYGYGQVSDGRVRDRIAEIDDQLARNR